MAEGSRKAGVFSGDKPTGAKVRSPVAWMARGRETEPWESIDKTIFRMGASRRAVTEVKAQVASKCLAPVGGWPGHRPISENEAVPRSSRFCDERDVGGWRTLSFSESLYSLKSGRVAQVLRLSAPGGWTCPISKKMAGWPRCLAFGHLGDREPSWALVPRRLY